MKCITSLIEKVELTYHDIEIVIRAIEAETTEKKWALGANSIKKQHLFTLSARHDQLAGKEPKSRDIVYGYGTVPTHADFLCKNNIATLVYCNAAEEELTLGTLCCSGEIILDSQEEAVQYGSMYPGSTIKLNDHLLHAWLCNGNWAFFISIYK